MPREYLIVLTQFFIINYMYSPFNSQTSLPGRTATQQGVSLSHFVITQSLVSLSLGLLPVRA